MTELTSAKEVDIKTAIAEAPIGRLPAVGKVLGIETPADACTNEQETD